VLFAQQVDLKPTADVKRVVNSDELAEMLKLGEQMKSAGNESFNAGDFRMAAVRYGQVASLLGSCRALTATDQGGLEALLRVSSRNASLAYLKTWAWGRAARACNEVGGWWVVVVVMLG